MEDKKMNEKENVESGQENVEGQDYIEALKEMKAKTVAKEQYDKLKAENAQLLQALVDGGTLPVQETKEEPVDLGKLRKELFNPDCDLTNLEFVERSLKLREEVIKQGGQDPFLPVGEHVSLTPEIIDGAERAAQVFQECIDLAQGDSGVFTAELQRRTKEVMPRYGKK